jgi:hypothetical protein
MSVGLLFVRFQYGLYVVVHLSKFISLFRVNICYVVSFYACCQHLDKRNPCVYLFETCVYFRFLRSYLAFLKNGENNCFSKNKYFFLNIQTI